MKMDKVANSKNDEFYTPAYAVRPILKYIPKGATVWCPFDTENSWFVKLLQARGNRAIYSHKDNGDDFFQCTSVISIKTYLAECDYIVSNPPYSLKTEVLKRLFDIEKPFAMLVGVVGLFESARRYFMFRDNKFEMLYLNKRVAFFKNFTDQKPSLNPPFSSAYVCSKMLPKQICFEEIVKGQGE